MKKNLLFILLLFLMFGLFACGSNNDSLIDEVSGGRVYGDSDVYTGSESFGTVVPGGYGYSKAEAAVDGVYYEPAGSFTGEYADVAAGVDDPMEAVITEEPVLPTETPEPTEEPVFEAGQLTASAYFDNDYYSFWKELVSTNQQGDGLFKVYKNKRDFNTENRIKVTLENTPYATVTVDDFTGVTNSNGEVYLFPSVVKDSYTIEISIPTEGGVTKLTKTLSDGNELYLSSDDIGVLVSKSEVIQLMFVVDTTGSMGDEISYLKSEIASVIDAVKEDNENVTIYLSLLFYRDKGDDYVTNFYDFSTDISLQQARLSREYASGGGDFPEAVAEALTVASEAQWMTKATKILVHVADAPDHEANYKAWHEVTLKLASLGVRVITVASSGIDKETEYFFRCEALLTNGCYGYLTNDSGIGGFHIDATTAEKMPVEYLNKMLIRLINGFYTGTFEEAVSWRGQE